jgi:hypothetical protein
MANETPRAGDCIAFENADGSYDVLRVSATGAHETVRERLTMLDRARDVARMNLGTGRILLCHYAAPDWFERF